MSDDEGQDPDHGTTSPSSLRGEQETASVLLASSGGAGDSLGFARRRRFYVLVGKLDEYGAVNLFPRLRVKELLGERESLEVLVLVLVLAPWERRSGVSYEKPTVCM